MTQDSSLAPPAATTSLGLRLRAARIAQGLSVEDVCARLKLSADVIQAMEADDHARLGAAVFARGRLGNYARLVGVPMVAVDAVFARLTRELPALVTARSTSRLERVAQRSARQGIYVVLTAVIFVVPLVWIANGNRLPDAPASLTALDVPPPAASHVTGAIPAPAVERNEPPVVASMAPFPGYRSTAPESRAAATPIAAASDSAAQAGASATPAASQDGALHLHFVASSWVDVVGRDGRSLEHGMITTGSDRSYPQGTLARVMIGNANAVQVLRDGHAIDLSPFRRANIVRFTLSSDGSPAPTGD
jgi:cytoskeleton protein RodZ